MTDIQCDNNYCSNRNKSGFCDLGYIEMACGLCQSFEENDENEDEQMISNYVFVRLRENITAASGGRQAQNT